MHVRFWGDTHKLLSNIIDNSIDNFLIVLSQASMIANIRESKEVLGASAYITTFEIVY